HLPIGQGRRPGERRAVVGLEQPHWPAAERRERAIEPGVAEERGLLEPLCGEERRAGRLRSLRNGLECMPFGCREPVASRRELFDQALEGGTDEWQPRNAARRPLRERGGLRCAEGL